MEKTTPRFDEKMVVTNGWEKSAAAAMVNSSGWDRAVSGWETPSWDKPSASNWDKPVINNVGAWEKPAGNVSGWEKTSSNNMSGWEKNSHNISGWDKQSPNSSGWDKPSGWDKAANQNAWDKPSAAGSWKPAPPPPPVTPHFIDNSATSRASSFYSQRFG